MTDYYERMERNNWADVKDTGFTPITYEAFSESCEEAWGGAIAEGVRLRAEKMQTAIEYARNTINTNEECFVAQWVLQNQDKNIDDYVMCYQHSGDVIKFWMSPKVGEKL